MDAALIVALTSLVAVFLTHFNQRKNSRLEAIKVEDRSMLRRAELDDLESKMLLDIAKEYKALNDPLEVKVAILEEEVTEYRELLEEEKTLNNQLQQTVNLQTVKIKYLENRICVLEKQLTELTNGKTTHP